MSDIITLTSTLTKTKKYYTDSTLLDLHNNELKELPKLPKGCKVYGMNKQKITSVIILGKEYDIETTTELNLSFKQLKELPKEIGKLINLQNLYIYNNQLKELPKEIGNLTNLQTLWLNDNELKELHELPKGCKVYGMDNQKIIISKDKNDDEYDELIKEYDIIYLY
jgi:Leucine-rich repeat (LRR) protein